MDSLIMALLQLKNSLGEKDARESLNKILDEVVVDVDDLIIRINDEASYVIEQC